MRFRRINPVALSVIIFFSLFVSGCHKEQQDKEYQDANPLKIMLSKSKYIKIGSGKGTITVNKPDEMARLINTPDYSFINRQGLAYEDPPDRRGHVTYYCGPVGNEEMVDICLDIDNDDTVSLFRMIDGFARARMPEYCRAVERIARKHGLDF